MQIANSKICSLQSAISNTPKAPAATVAQVLQEGAGLLSRLGIASARLDAELLLSKALKRTREELYSYPEHSVAPEAKGCFDGLMGRRAKGEPLAYILGEREFWSLAFYVSPEVLVPRPETEVLVEVALDLAKKQARRGPIKILDLGTGSGAIAVVLAKELTGAEVWATDLSARTLEVARANAQRHRVDERLRFRQGDLFSSLSDGERNFDLIVSNPPYVRDEEFKKLPREIRNWEPRLALDGGVEGLAFYRRIGQEAHRYLAAGGILVLEIGADMGQEVCGLLASTGCYSTPLLRQDYAGKDRVVIAQRLPCRELSRTIPSAARING